MNWLVYGGAAALAAVVVAWLDRMSLRVVEPLPPDPNGRRLSVPGLGVPHEDLTIPSGDHTLAAWLLCPGEPHPDEPLVLLAHGWGASYQTVLELGEPLARAGQDVLLFDVRGHGRSQPAPYVTVRHFRDDVRAAVDYAARRFPGRRLVLVGHSLGGAGAVLAVADGAAVDALALIATPADIPTITAEYMSDRGLPGRLLTTLMRPFWWRRIGGSFRPLTPRRRIREIDVPLLMIHPENDGRVARRHAEWLSRAAGVAYHLVPDREHTDVLSAPETLRLVLDFVAEVRGTPEDS